MVPEVGGPLNIVVTTAHLAQAGGAERMLTTAALAARRDGHAVSVICKHPVDPQLEYVRELDDVGVEVIGPPAGRHGVVERVLRLLRMAVAPVAFPLYWARRRGRPGAWPRLVSELTYEIERRPLSWWLSLTQRHNLQATHARRHIDVIHAHRSDGALLIVAAWAGDAGVPMLYHEHSGLTNLQSRQLPPWSYTEQELTTIRRNCTVAVLAPSIEPRVRDLFGLDTRVVVVPNWLGLDWDDAATPTTNEVCRIATVTRLVENKGLEQLVDAAATAQDRGASLHCTIAGDGPLLDALRLRAAERGAADVVHFPGRLPRGEVMRLLAESDVFALPSDDEGMPMSLLEAMASGCAVVVTPVGAMADMVVDGDSGRVVSAGDVEELAGVLLELASRPDLRRSLAMRGREVIEARYREDAAWPTLAEVYRALCAPTPQRQD